MFLSSNNQASRNNYAVNLIFLRIILKESNLLRDFIPRCKREKNHEPICQNQDNHQEDLQDGMLSFSKYLHQHSHHLSNLQFQYQLLDVNQQIQYFMKGLEKSDSQLETPHDKIWSSTCNLCLINKQGSNILQKRNKKLGKDRKDNVWLRIMGTSTRKLNNL